jgi:hypothetical protein
MIRVKRARHVRDYVVEFTFTDDSTREIDLEPYFWGPIFEPLKDIEFFKKFRIDRELGTIVWPNGADIDPDVLYLGLTPAWREAHAH